MLCGVRRAGFKLAPTNSQLLPEQGRVANNRPCRSAPQRFFYATAPRPGRDNPAGGDLSLNNSIHRISICVFFLYFSRQQLSTACPAVRPARMKTPLPRLAIQLRSLPTPRKSLPTPRKKALILAHSSTPKAESSARVASQWETPGCTTSRSSLVPSGYREQEKLQAPHQTLKVPAPGSERLKSRRVQSSASNWPLQRLISSASTSSVGVPERLNRGPDGSLCRLGPFRRSQPVQMFAFLDFLALGGAKLRSDMLPCNGRPLGPNPARTWAHNPREPASSPDPSQSLCPPRK